MQNITGYQTPGASNQNLNSAEFAQADAHTSLFCDALSYYFTARGVPPRLRQGLITIYGAAGGDVDYFPMGHAAAGKRCWHYDDRDWPDEETRVREREKVERRWAKLFHDLCEWQRVAAGESKLFDFRQGGLAPSGKRETTEYRADCLPSISQIVRRAAGAPDPRRAVRQIAYQVAQRDANCPLPRGRTKRRKTRGPQTPDDLFERAVADGLKYAEADPVLSPREAVERVVRALREAVLPPEDYPDGWSAWEGEEKRLSPQNSPQTPDSVEDVALGGKIGTLEIETRFGPSKSTTISAPDDEPEPEPPPCAPPPPTSAGEEEGAQGGALSIFVSAGVESFDVTVKDDRKGEAVDYLPGLSPEEFGRIEAKVVEHSRRAGLSLIVRPRGADLYQMDDLGREALERAAPFAFGGFETSTENFQDWLLITGGDHSTRRRLVRGLGADPGASGALRWPGSLNFKHDPPTEVRVVFSQPGRRATVEELERAGLLAPVEKMSTGVNKISTGPRAWPDYDLCATEVRGRSDGGDTSDSAIDFRFCLYSSGRGYSAAEIEARLGEVSDSARRKGWRYRDRTARLAAEKAGARCL